VTDAILYSLMHVTVVVSLKIQQDIKNAFLCKCIFAYVCTMHVKKQSIKTAE